MICPECKKAVRGPHVISKCLQRAIVSNGKIVDYGQVKQILEVLEIKCPRCKKDIGKYLKK